MKIYTNGINKDYLMINVKLHVGALIFREDLDEEISKEIKAIYFGLFTYEKNTSKSYLREDVAVKKDSTLGSWLLENCENADDFITFNKVTNAMNIAIMEENIKMSNKIMPLFKRQVEGKKDEFKDENPTVINYILNNPSLEDFLGINDDKEFLVYEDGTFDKRKLTKEKEKQLIKER